MVSSEARAIYAVELAIIRQEGALAVNGVPFTSAIEAELARRSVAERTVAEASRFGRPILDPSCAWCDERITPEQDARVVYGRLYHQGNDTPDCAVQFEDECEAYAADRAAEASAC